jgi:quinoprotein glucose dehydrogenase
MRFSGPAIAAILLALSSCTPAPHARGQLAEAEWPAFGGGPDNIKYSPLAEITPENVHRLEIAWTYETGDAFEGSEMQTNPLVVEGRLYAITPKQRLIALDAADGRLLWRFDPDPRGELGGSSRNRGLATWSDGQRRLLFHAARHWLWAIDAATGAPLAGFGDGGRIDLRQGLARDPETLSVSATSPGIVYRDLLIIGSSLAEDLPAAPGDIRAFDVRSGKLVWSFRTIPAPGEPGSETWGPGARERSGGANSWAGLALDAGRGLVFAPTGSAAFDFWGGDRPGDNLFADSLLALDAATGTRVWHFQTVRHDIWDRDLPAAPSLVTVRRGGRAIDAVAQITKTGYVYLFERATGAPLFPIELVPAPPSDVPGEATAPSQPRPVLPPPFVRHRFEPTRRAPAAEADVAKRLAGLRSGHLFEPPSLQGTLVYPGLDGGGEWGGAAFDPETGLLYVNANEMGWVVRLLRRDQPAGIASARELYEANCAGCHRSDLRGTAGQVPPLTGLPQRRTPAQVEAVIRRGSARMPAFAELGEEAVRALTRFLLTGRDEAAASAGSVNRLPFRLQGYDRFLDPEGYPAVAPPWGTLSAIDLASGSIRWQVPLGEYPALAAQGLRDTGSENYGGPVVTAGGLLFVGATVFDRKLRAFDKRTGRLLWETLLPAAGTATPAVYRARGRQFVVIAAGGGKGGQKSGGSYIAFALPGKD